MKNLFNNPLSCRKILASIALTLAATTSLLTPALSFAQTNPRGQGVQGVQGEQRATPLTAPQPIPRGDGGCDSTCSLGVPGAPPLVSQSCVSNQETRSIACSNPTPVGTINQRRSPVYCNGVIVSGDTWANVSNNCVALVCTPTTSTQTIACPAGYSGGINQSKTDTSCNDGTSTPGTWATISNSCVVIPCGPTSPNTNAACGPGFNSGLVTTVYSMSAAPACKQTSAVSNNCACNLKTITTPNNQCQAGYLGTYTVTKTPIIATCTYVTTDDSLTVCKPGPPPPAFCNPNICVNGGTYNGTRCERATACLTGPTANPGLEYYNINTGVRNSGAGCPATSAWTTSSAATCAPVVCPATTPSSSVKCGVGFDTGNITTTYIRAAAPDCRQTSTVSNNCSCGLTASKTPTACPAGFNGKYTVTQSPNAACSGYNTSNSGGSCTPAANQLSSSLVVPGFIEPFVCFRGFAKFAEIFIRDNCTSPYGCSFMKVVQPQVFGNSECYHFIQNFQGPPICLPQYHMVSSSLGITCEINMPGQPITCPPGYNIEGAGGYGIVSPPGTLFCSPA